MSLRNKLIQLRLLPQHDGRGWPEPDLASTAVRYARACCLVGHEALTQDNLESALRELRYGCEDAGRATWAWQDPSLKELRTGANRGNFARVVSVQPDFVAGARLIAEPRNGSEHDVEITLIVPSLSRDSTSPGFKVEVGQGSASIDREAWKAWTRLRWRPPIASANGVTGEATYTAKLRIEKGAVLLGRFRAAGLPWEYVGATEYAAGGLSADRFIAPLTPERHSSSRANRKTPATAPAKQTP